MLVEVLQVFLSSGLRLVSVFALSFRERTSTCCSVCFCWRPGEPCSWPVAFTGWATNRPTSPTRTTRRPTPPRSSPGRWPSSTCPPSTSGCSSARTRSASIGRWTPCLWSGAWLIGGTYILRSSTLGWCRWLGSACGRTTRPRAKTPTAKRTITPTAGTETATDTVSSITITNIWTTPTQALTTVVHRTVPKRTTRAGLHCPPLKTWWCSP